jgi:hypothetical protein
LADFWKDTIADVNLSGGSQAFAMGDCETTSLPWHLVFDLLWMIDWLYSAHYWSMNPWTRSKTHQATRITRTLRKRLCLSFQRSEFLTRRPGCMWDPWLVRILRNAVDRM